MAFGIDDAVTAVSTTVGKIIDKIFPDPAQAAQAKAVLMTAEVQGDIQRTTAELSAIVAEANSQDKWTSRARPSFMYVIYTMILMSIPMGVLWAFSPAYAERIAKGASMWLGMVPDGLWQLFAMGYLGYTGGRTFEKWKGVKK
jgi:hypothetical protein